MSNRRDTVYSDVEGAFANATGADTGGGIGDGDPCSLAIQRAIRARDPVRGAWLQFGVGGYRIDRLMLEGLPSLIVADRPVVLRGQGVTSTTLYVDADVAAAFRVGQGPLGLGTGGDASGFGITFENIGIKAVARRQVSVTASFEWLTRTLTLDDDAGIKDGDTIAIAGAGNDANLEDVYAETQAGSPIVVVRGHEPGSSRGIFAGAYLRVGLNMGSSAPFDLERVEAIASPWGPAEFRTVGDLAYPTGVSGEATAHQYVVVSGTGHTGSTPPTWPVNGGTVVDGDLTWLDLGLEVTAARMASNAASTAAAVPVKTRLERLTRVLSGGGTTTLVVDSAYGAGRDLANVRVRQSSCAIDARYQMKMHNVLIEGFEGPGIFMGAGGLYNPPSNANLSRLNDVNIYRCRNAIVVAGADVQASTFDGVVSVQSREWAAVDDSQTNNAWRDFHADGGFGLIMTESSNSFVGNRYREKGTYFSLGDPDKVVVVGPDCPVQLGTLRALRVGSDRTKHRLRARPEGEWLALLQQDGTEDGISIRESPEHPGYLEVIYVAPGQTRKRAFVISIKNLTLTPEQIAEGLQRALGEIVFTRGLRIGGSPTNGIDPSYESLLWTADEEPETDLDAFNPEPWKIPTFLLVTGRRVDWPRALKTLVREGHGCRFWIGDHVTAVGNEMRLRVDDGFRYVCTDIGAAPHKTGSTEPASAAVIVDNDVTWERDGTSALWANIASA